MIPPVSVLWRLAAVALVLMPAPSVAQDPFRQTVVVTAAARPAELGSVPRTLMVVTREQIDALPFQSVADLLRLLASVDVRARGAGGAQTDFVLRGATFGQSLILVDGVRLNDAQSGHHNGDIPVPLDLVDRIEVLYGPGSSLFGADALGGTINIVTRPASAAPSLRVQGGSFGFASVRGQAGIGEDTVRQTIGAQLDRSDGFMYDRDHRTAIVRSQTAFGARSRLGVSYLWKEFGANNFYGGNAPSREWTNQTLVAFDHVAGTVAGWNLQTRASYRTHGDRFVFNQEQPALSDNRHRTHAAIGAVSASRPVRLGGTATLGVEGAGEWIRSSNLGDHAIARLSGYGEWRQPVGRTVQLDALVRMDRYDEFGTAWNPSFAAGWWLSSGVRLRGSVARAFRVPTFTERYYSDPANLARPDVGPETTWALEGGMDALLAGRWLVQATVFHRADADVIDWLRPTAADRWQTYNVRAVRTVGVELAARRPLGGGSFLQVQYTGLDVDADEVTQLSKYVLDYAPHSLTAAASLALPARLHLSPRIEFRRRSRPGSLSNDVVLDARVGKRLGARFDLYVDGTNLLDDRYQEVAGVPMPGAAVSVGVAIGN